MGASNIDQPGPPPLVRDTPMAWRSRSKCRRTTARHAALLVAGVILCSGDANATSSCQGTYAATSLQPLPDQMVVDLDVRDRSQRNLMLADRFLKGVREAGVMVGQDANVLLHYVSSGGDLIWD